MTPTPREIVHIKWKHFLNRPEAPLFESISCLAYLQFAKETKIPWHPHSALYFSTGPVYYDPTELEKLHALYLQGGLRRLQKVAILTRRYIGAFDRLAITLSHIDATHLSASQVRKLIDRYLAVAIKGHQFLVPVVVAERTLTEMLHTVLPSTSEAERTEWIRQLVVPVQQNSHSKEQLAFLMLVEKIQQQPAQKHNLIARHLRQYGWIGARWYWWHLAWTQKDVEERIKEYLHVGKTPKQDLKRLIAARTRDLRRARQLERQLSRRTGPSFKPVVHLAREFLYLRTLRTDVLYGGGYRMRHILGEFLRRAGKIPDDVVYLSASELSTFARTGRFPLSNQQFIERKKFWVNALIHQKHYLLSGKKWEKGLAMLANPKQALQQSVSGQTAYAGKITGYVRIVKDVSDIDSVRPGDVLVATMTFPHFIAAMEKAAAFVTDEGGLLCHAAIVAREMGKPCVIGTKIATKAFKDGDLVEVDATRGIVRKV